MSLRTGASVSRSWIRVRRWKPARGSLIRVRVAGDCSSSTLSRRPGALNPRAAARRSGSKSGPADPALTRVRVWPTVPARDWGPFIPAFEVLPSGDRDFQLHGELDMAMVDAFLENTAGALDSPGDIVLDLTRLTFIDSSGLKAVAELAQRVDGIVVLRCPPPNVLRILDILGVNSAVGIRIVG